MHHQSGAFFVPLYQALCQSVSGGNRLERGEVSVLCHADCEVEWALEGGEDDKKVTRSSLTVQSSPVIQLKQLEGDHSTAAQAL
jgi:hypothetical protein